VVGCTYNMLPGVKIPDHDGFVLGSRYDFRFIKLKAHELVGMALECVDGSVRVGIPNLASYTRKLLESTP